MTAEHGVTPEEMERAVLRLLAGTPPATLADALDSDVHQVLAWAQIYVNAGRVALRPGSQGKTPAIDSMADSATQGDPRVADRHCGDAPAGGSAGSEIGQGGDGSSPVTFSAVAGLRADLDRVQQEWQDIVGIEFAARTRVPELLAPPPSVEDTDPAAFRIAEFRHDPGVGGQLVLRVRGGMRERGLTDVIAEEGFFLQPAAGVGGAGDAQQAPGKKASNAPAQRWETTWWEKDLRDHQAFLATPVPAGALGAELLKQVAGESNFALIDSGDERAQEQHMGPGLDEPRDAIGHGSSVGDLIRLAFRTSHNGMEAHLECYQVFHGGAKVARSVDVALAMSFAIAARFTIVVLPLIASVPAEDRYGWDHHHSLMRAAIDGTGRQTRHMPVFVCAGGNFTGRPMSEPATLPGAVVVRATDWNKTLASYNSLAPQPPPCLVDALGGDFGRPLGLCGPIGAAETGCYGTSFSTALVAGTLAARNR